MAEPVLDLMFGMVVGRGKNGPSDAVVTAAIARSTARDNNATGTTRLLLVLGTVVVVAAIALLGFVVYVTRDKAEYIDKWIGPAREIAGYLLAAVVARRHRNRSRPPSDAE